MGIQISLRPRWYRSEYQAEKRKGTKKCALAHGLHPRIRGRRMSLRSHWFSEMRLRLLPLMSVDGELFHTLGPVLFKVSEDSLVRQVQFARIFPVLP